MLLQQWRQSRRRESRGRATLRHILYHIEWQAGPHILQHILTIRKKSCAHGVSSLLELLAALHTSGGIRGAHRRAARAPPEQEHTLSHTPQYIRGNTCNCSISQSSVIVSLSDTRFLRSAWDSSSAPISSKNKKRRRRSSEIVSRGWLGERSSNKNSQEQSRVKIVHDTSRPDNTRSAFFSRPSTAAGSAAEGRLWQSRARVCGTHRIAALCGGSGDFFSGFPGRDLYVLY